MKKILSIATLALISSTAFAKNTSQTAPALSIDSKVEVAYTCAMDKDKTQKINVMYGIKNGEPIVAQVKVNQEISPGLFRVADPLLNRFVSEGKDGTMWTALPARADKLRSVDGGTLSIKQNNTNAIVVEKCQLDKAATAKLK